MKHAAHNLNSSTSIALSIKRQNMSTLNKTIGDHATKVETNAGKNQMFKKNVEAN